MANKLTLYKEYSREEVHEIFSPETKFTKSRGPWGLSGIVKISNNKPDYIFFVTYSESKNGTELEEGIDDEGVLSWHSQKRQGFKNQDISNFINHDENINNIYLFLRNSKSFKYKYQGLLKYKENDENKEYPVHFKWTIINFNSKEINNIGITPFVSKKKQKLDLNKNELRFNEPPAPRTSLSKDRKIDPLKAGFVKFDQLHENNTELGNLGEDLVVEFEKNELNKIGRTDLAQMVYATRKKIGNNAKFDVLSYFPDGKEKYIEVKTTREGINNPFFISESEVKFSQKYKDQYFIYRVYEYDLTRNNAEIFVLRGQVNREKLTPTNYYYNY